MHAILTRRNALLASGLMGFVIPTIFAWQVFRNNLPENIATWAMILFLDVLGLVLVYKAGNKRPYLQLGWCLAAICIVAAVSLNDIPWHWGWVENVSLVCCAFAIWRLLAKSAEQGLWFYLAAGTIAFVPQAIDFWEAPQPETVYLWLGTVVGCACAIYGSERRDFAHTAIPWTFGILNVFITILVLR